MYNSLIVNTRKTISKSFQTVFRRRRGGRVTDTIMYGEEGGTGYCEVVNDSSEKNGPSTRLQYNTAACYIRIVFIRCVAEGIKTFPTKTLQHIGRLSPATQSYATTRAPSTCLRARFSCFARSAHADHDDFMIIRTRTGTVEEGSFS